MAKKKAAPKKPAASKRRPAAAKSTGKRTVAKPAAKKTVAKKSPPAPKTKAVAKSKPAVKSVKPPAKSASRPETKSSEKPRKRIPAMFAPCPWDLRDVKVTFSESTYTTHFHYVRTNPVTCRVRVWYAGTVNGPLDNEIGFPRDHGEADCTGTPHDWDADQLISSQHLVRIQLFLNDQAKTAARDVVVVSVP